MGGIPIYDAWDFKIILLSAFLITSAILIMALTTERNCYGFLKFNKYGVMVSIVLAICGVAISLNMFLASSPFLLDGRQYDIEKIVEDNNIKIEHRAYYEKLNDENWVLKAEHKGYLSENGIEPGVVYIVQWQSGYGNKIIKAFVYEDENSTPDPHVNDYLDYKYKDDTVSGND